MREGGKEERKEERKEMKEERRKGGKEARTNERKGRRRRTWVQVFSRATFHDGLANRCFLEREKGRRRE